MSYMPIQGSTIAKEVDLLFDFTVWSSVLACIILLGGMTFFIIKYQRRSDNDKTAHISHNHLLEFIWSFIPLVIFLGMFYWGWHVYSKMRTFPADAMEISITGRQWAWDMTYSTGKKVTNELVIPVETPVVLNMTSVDVIHSFYVPSFRVKQDVVPGKRSKMWFQSDKLGDYELFCTEFCGTAHSGMIGKVRVVTRAEYDVWIKKDKSTMTPAELGKDHFVSKGCVACHSTDGSIKVGPSLKAVWGSTVKHSDGSSALVDEGYVRSSILNPQEKYVAGFQGVIMPSFQGLITEDEINEIVEYLKTLK
ncbi:MAG: cytochrome c oxidase subunit II [Bdellovibrionota bacterium]